MPLQDAENGYITIDAAPGRWRARFNDGVLADSTEALVLRERGLPDRIYFPSSDVEQGYLSPTQRTTHCPHKGDARYWSVEYNGEVGENAVWSYPEAKAQVSAIAGRLAFDESKGFEVYRADGIAGHSVTDDERKA